MVKKLRSSKDLSGRCFKLTPVYNAGGSPQKIPSDDRLFDPKIDAFAHWPDYVGTIENRELFSAPVFGGVEDYTVMIKPPQSHVYWVPVELSQSREFLQKAIDYEHSRSPLAFTCAAFLSFRQNGFAPSQWHFDAGVDENKGIGYIDYPTSVYVCADVDPTEYAFNYKFPKRLREKFADSSDWYGLTQSQKMVEIANEYDPEDWCETKRADIRSYEPYDISRHNILVLHRGIRSENRTSMVLDYAHNRWEEYLLSVGIGEDAMVNPHFGQTLKKMKRETAPVEQAVELQNAYFERYYG